MMKKFFLLLLVASLSVSTAWTQSSSKGSVKYRAVIDNGDKLYKSGSYNEALEKYKMAIKTPGADKSEAQQKIDRCIKAIEDVHKRNSIAADEARKERQRKGLAALKKGKESFEKGLWVDARMNFIRAKDYGISDAESWLARCQDEINKEQGYIEVSNVEFSIATYFETLIPFGGELYASDLTDRTRLLVRIHYNTLDDGSHYMTPCFRIIDRDGNMLSANPAAEYTAVGLEKNVRADEHVMLSIIRGDFSPLPGTYTFQMLNNDKVLYQTQITLHKKKGEALYLTLDGQTHISDVLDPQGGIVTYEVNTDGHNPTLEGLPSGVQAWCQFDLSDNMLTIKYRPNHAIRKDLSFKVACGGRSVPVELLQLNWNMVSEGDWTTFLSANVGKVMNKVRYHGEPESKKSTYYGIMYWESVDMWFFGEIENHVRKRGVYLSGNPRVYGIFEHTVFYAGSFEKGLMTDGACYDRFGNYLYKGPFVGDYPSPRSAYPLQSSYFPSDYNTDYRFDFVREDNGDYYLGETYQGKRHGYGIYFYANGGYWVGTWEYDESSNGAYVSQDGNTTDRLSYKNHF